MTRVALSRNSRSNGALPACARAEQAFVTPSRNAERGVDIDYAIGSSVREVVVGPDGRRLVRFHGVFVDQPHVCQGQIIQQAVDRIRVRVVPDVEEISRRVRQRPGSQVNMVVETVKEVPRTAAGKFRAVISMLDRN